MSNCIGTGCKATVLYEQISNLRAELDEMKKAREPMSATDERALIVRAAKAEAELAAAQDSDDARRYRWLRQNPTYLGWEHDCTPKFIDTNIDDAMLTKKEKT